MGENSDPIGSIGQVRGPWSSPEWHPSAPLASSSVGSSATHSGDDHGSRSGALLGMPLAFAASLLIWALVFWSLWR